MKEMTLGVTPSFVSHLDDGFACMSLPVRLPRLGVLSRSHGALQAVELRPKILIYSPEVFTIFAGRKNISPRRFQQAKTRVVNAPKKLGRVGGPREKNGPILEGPSSGEEIHLNEDQAIGQVVTAQANFMRVIVQQKGANREESEGLGYSGDRGALNLQEDGKEGGIRSGENGCIDSNSGHAQAGQGAELEEGNGANAAKTLNPVKELELLCVVRNVLKKIRRRVLVGDRVLVTGIDWVEKGGMIEDVIDRQSEILDPPVANVNHLLVVFSIAQPQIDEKVLSRFLVEAESTDIPFSLVLNKVDLVKPEVATYWQGRLASWGYGPVFCSADLRIGLSTLTGLLKHRIAVILGPSGVGKSSLINALRDQKALSMWNEAEKRLSQRVAAGVAGAELPKQEVIEEAFEKLRVSEVSAGSGRGRHTTRHVSLLCVPGGSGRLADTPGFSLPSLAKVTSTSLPDLFPEAGRAIEDSENGGCGFPNCFHIGEPFCAVGEDWDRYSHYVALLEEVQNRERVEKRVLGTKRESGVRYRVRSDGVMQAEPRLALKKYRRESRKHLNQSLEEIFREEEELQADIVRSEFL